MCLLIGEIQDPLEAIAVKSRHDLHRQEHPRLANEMPAKAVTLAKDETFSGGLCLVSLEPKSNYIILEQAAEGRDQDTWNTLMERALAGLNCQVIRSTSDEAPGLLAYVEHHLGAHHSPDVFHVQHELVKAVCAPLATKQRAASKVEGRNGYLSLRNHQLRGLDRPRKRECLTAVHNFFLTRPDGTTAAERFFGQKPRSMFAAILDSVDLPPAPLSQPRRARGVG
jgi:hypothetical protein